MCCSVTRVTNKCSVYVTFECTFARTGKGFIFKMLVVLLYLKGMVNGNIFSLFKTDMTVTHP